MLARRSEGFRGTHHSTRQIAAELDISQLFVINVKNDVYKDGYRRLSCTSKTAKIHRFITLVMYCIITTVLVAFL